MGEELPFPVLKRASRALATVEERLAAILAAVVFLLLLGNIVTRSAGMAVFWIDEAAVLAMVWMAFFAASSAIERGSNIAVTLFSDALPLLGRRLAAVAVDGIMLLFILGFALMVWRWFDPLGVLAAGGDLEEFSATTFNFIYSEPTQSLDMPKFWFWTVLPLFVLGASFHCLSNLLSSLGVLLGKGR
ncbi:TRAP transporter small permease [Telmatospirillum sp. J64-1]|uniref:TRAP transporter small permease n=1 Tax=Telmatospirillum sp. J64-1 TaxID=2502183 RepID=UPI00163D42D0|nr:TRAP transporter small permease subunit [Telmatospirillum sp. J64-1]